MTTFFLQAGAVETMGLANECGRDFDAQSTLQILISFLALKPYTRHLALQGPVSLRELQVNVTLLREVSPSHIYSASVF